MTEEEAKTKLCPMAMLPVSTGKGKAKNFNIPCQGSECMVWRWESFDPYQQAQRSGFCGMGGKP